MQMGKTSNRKMTAGLLGAGYISEFHVRGLRRLPNVEIVGVADTSLDRAKELAERHGLPATFSSLAELQRLKPDVIHILTPPDAHADNAIEALQGGSHVLVEKPLATSVEDCDRIAAAATAAGKTVCVGHSLLRDPFFERALDIARSGAIGDVLGVDHFRSQVYPRYEGGPLPPQYRQGGFPFRDLGVHSLYMLEAFLGQIHDVAPQLGPPSNDGCPRYKEWRALVRCERGIGQLYMSWNVLPLQDMLLIHGTRGVIRADIFGMSVTVRKTSRLPDHAERVLNTFNEGRRMATQIMGNVLRVVRKKLLHYHGLQMVVGEFYKSLEAGTPPPVTIEQARPIVDWTERVARQADLAQEQFVSGFSHGGTAKVLVTGATGFIGNHLLQRLLEEKGRVRILVRRAPSNEVLNDDRVEVALGDLGDPADVDRAVEGISELYHLGAAVEGHPEDFQCATVVGTRNIVESSLRHGVEKLIYMSSLSVLDAAKARPRDKITEDWPLEPFPECRGAYSQTKLAAEQLVLEAVRTRGLRAILLRPGEVIGPDRPFMSGAVAIETGSRLVVLGNGKATLPLVWVEDLVDAIVAAGKSDLFDGSVFHIVDSEEVPQDEIAQHYLRTTHQEKSIVHLPLSVLYTAAGGATAAARTLGRSSPITPYRIRSAVGSRHFDCSSISKALGWRPRVGVRAGMKSMLNGTDSDNGSVKQ